MDITFHFRYKWITVSCDEEWSFLCSATAPICPPGHTWIPKASRERLACFKTTDIQRVTDYSAYRDAG